MKVAVYSGSFNPLHIGHLAILKYLVSDGGFDCVYLIVSPKNPLKEGISADSGRDRYNAAAAAVARHFHHQAGDLGISECSGRTRKVIVDDIELNMQPPHYTIRTLDALKEREPENRFTLIMGADNLADIRRWRDYRRILKEFGTAVYPRKGFDLISIKNDLTSEDQEFSIRILDAKMVDISSTIIRDCIADGQDMSEWLM